MKLPNRNEAEVSERKVRLYLLNPAHPVGGSKASFFVRFGFGAESWRELADALLQHGRDNDVVQSQQTSHGTRYVVDGPLKAPNGTTLNIRTAWFIEPGQSSPRFITAHPLPKS
jgi:hypothetical protein